MASVMIVDDEELVLSILQHRLQSEGYTVFTASSGLGALRLARRHHPDLFILDISMPGMDGLELCRRLRADPAFDQALILFLTSLDEVDQRVAGLEAGGDDYLSKPFDFGELLARVRALLRRIRRDAPNSEAERVVLRTERLVLHPGVSEVVCDGKRVVLTRVQLDLLYHLMTHPDEVHGAEELLTQVWGYAPGTGDTGLVRYHISRLREKLQDDAGSPVVIRTVKGHGYTVGPPS